MEREQIKTILVELKKNYRTFEISDTTAAWWHEALTQFEDAEVFQAVKNWVFTEKWPPTIADIVQSLDKARMPAWASQDALEAWSCRSTNPIAKAVFLELERTYGPYGSWQTEDNQWRYKEFSERYAARLERKKDSVKNRLLLEDGPREALPSPAQSLVALATPKVTQ